MIKKPRTKPLKLLKLDAILQRLVHNHLKHGELQIEFARYSAGYRGEVALDYFLHDLDENSYLIFHDLRLPSTTFRLTVWFFILRFAFCSKLKISQAIYILIITSIR